MTIRRAAALCCVLVSMTSCTGSDSQGAAPTEASSASTAASTSVPTSTTSTPSPTTAAATMPPTTPAPATTAPADPVIAAAGDIACAPEIEAFQDLAGTEAECHMAQVSDLLVGGDHAAVLALGDLQYEEGAAAAFAASYDPTWGRVKDITLPAIGNHEYGTGGDGYFQYFGAAAGEPGMGWYGVDVGAWHLVALNSNCTVVDCAAGSDQEQWLRAELAAHPAACTLVYWHHPRFSSGLHGSDPALADLYRAADEGGADVVLSGHDHHYERFAPQDADGNATPDGPRQFVVGTGGRNHYPVLATVSNSEVHDDVTFGVLELTLRADGYDWRFVPDATGTFTDTGSADCR